MRVNATQLAKIMEGAGPKVIAHYLPHINAALEEFGITSDKAVAHFLAQLGHETGSLSRMSENLTYSKPERLMQVWPSRFKTIESALPYVRQPEKLANFVYAGRMGNGTPESGDGWRHRGLGGFQITGKYNQLKCAERFKIQPSKISEWLQTPEGAIRSSAWFFSTSGALVQAELGKLDKVSDIINLGKMTDKVGDAIGYTHRSYLTNTALNTLQRDMA
jgi:putative chitinase